MNQSSDMDKILKTLVQAGVLELESKNNHRKYRAALEYARDKRQRKVVAASTPSDVRAVDNLKAVLRRVLKPGVLEKTMGWTKKEPQMAAAVSSLVDKFHVPSNRVDPFSVSSAMQADRVSPHSMRSEDVVKIEHRTMAPSFVIDPKSVRETGQEVPVKIIPEPIATPPAPPEKLSTMQLPDKVTLTPQNRLLGEVLNSYLDRGESLKKSIKDREQVIENLRLMNTQEQAEFKEVLEFVEQLSLTLIALPSTALPMPGIFRSAPVSSQPSEPTRRLNGRQLLEEMGKVCASDKSRAFTIDQIIEKLTSQRLGVNSNRGMRDFLNHVIYQAEREEWRLTFKRHTKGQKGTPATFTSIL
jgi:hypothetical protein